ncbi:hypothetical protein LZ24_00618 [Desulfobotulus alkaliphilus]|uniref:Uncharacterized protein n=1 Tax=Desulfobotulus alkaliphilus TaxID=622671 RepID=A0A562S2G3_9BACT|nr:hypothetical protein LZ24_00618 [Desulfobotulus alkaliphilus]
MTETLNPPMAKARSFTATFGNNVKLFLIWCSSRKSDGIRAYQVKQVLLAIEKMGVSHGTKK